MWESLGFFLGTVSPEMEIKHSVKVTLHSISCDILIISCVFRHLLNTTKDTVLQYQSQN